MVRLNKIYTRTGDDGTTGLGDGARRAKFDPRVAAYGEVDETNCAIGLARLATHGRDDARLAPIDATLARVQNDLFDLGADLCTPAREGRAGSSACASYRARSSGSSATSTSSTPIFRRCAPSCCRAGRRRRRAASGARDLPARRAQHRRARRERRRDGRRAGARLYQPAVGLSVRRRALRQRSRPRRRAMGSRRKPKRDELDEPISVRSAAAALPRHRRPRPALSRRAHLLRRPQLRRPRARNGPCRSIAKSRSTSPRARRRCANRARPCPTRRARPTIISNSSSSSRSARRPSRSPPPTRSAPSIGYACGLDMTRRDLQLSERAKQRPWTLGKDVEASAPVSPIAPAARIGHPTNGRDRIAARTASCANPPTSARWSGRRRRSSRISPASIISGPAT